MWCFTYISSCEISIYRPFYPVSIIYRCKVSIYRLFYQQFQSTYRHKVSIYRRLDQQFQSTVAGSVYYYSLEPVKSSAGFQFQSTVAGQFQSVAGFHHFNLPSPGFIISIYRRRISQFQSTVANNFNLPSPFLIS